MLYSGPWYNVPPITALRNSVPASRSIRTLFKKVLLSDSYQLANPRSEPTDSDFIYKLSDNPMENFKTNFGTRSPIRGAFTVLDASKLDLPSHPTSSQPLWLTALPAPVQQMFSTPSTQSQIDSPIVAPLLRELAKTPHPVFPRPRLHCRKGHYERILHMADNAGVVQWSLVRTESLRYKLLADQLTMSSFAVVKDADQDRMISWPRVQNEFMLDPPHVSLPNPSSFQHLRIPSYSKLKAFYLDISNMFHNMRLPDWLSRLFPLQCIKFSPLPQPLQEKLSRQFGLNIEDDDLLRPIQATIPMGFKWAVYIAHTFSTSCVQKAFALFRQTSLLTFRTRLVSFADSKGVLQTESRDAILFHIIDDVNVVTLDWTDEHVKIFHKLAFLVFEEAGLPIKLSKSLELGKVESNMLRFLGRIFDFASLSFRPRQEKFDQISCKVLRLLALPFPPSTEIRRCVGKLLWLSLGMRPAISVISHVFAVSHNLASTGTDSRDRPSHLSLLHAATREIRLIHTLSPLSLVKLQRPLWTTVICCDASQEAAGIVYGDAPTDVIAHVIAEYQLLLDSRRRFLFLGPVPTLSYTKSSLNSPATHHEPQHSHISGENLNTSTVSKCMLPF